MLEPPDLNELILERDYGCDHLGLAGLDNSKISLETLK